MAEVVSPSGSRSPTRSPAGFGPEVIAGQIIAAFCNGGTLWVDSERLNAGPLAGNRAGPGATLRAAQLHNQNSGKL